MKKIIALGLGFLMIITLLAGCNTADNNTGTTDTGTTDTSDTGSSTDDTTSSSDGAVIGEGGDVQLRMATWWGGDTVATFEEVIRAYTETDPDVSVELMVWPWGEYSEKIISSHAGGDAPDIVMMDTGWHFMNYYERGLLEPLNSFVDSTGFDDMNKWLPGALDLHTIDGNLIAVPLHREQLIIWWNPGLFEMAGLPPLPDQPIWDEVHTAAEAIWNLGEDDEGRKYLGINTIGYCFLAYLADLGINFINSDGTVTMNTPEIMAAAEEVYSSYLLYGPSGAEQFNPMHAGIMGMEVGQWFGHPNEVGHSLDFEVRISNFPVINRDKTSQLLFSSCNSLGMNSGSKHKDKTFDVLSFFSSDEGRWILKAMVLPPAAGPARDEIETPKDTFPFNAGQIVSNLPDALVASLPAYGWNIAFMDKLWFGDVKAGALTMEQYLENMEFAVEDWYAVN